MWFVCLLFSQTPSPHAHSESPRNSLWAPGMVPAVFRELRWPMASWFPDLSGWMVEGSYALAQRSPSSYLHWIYFTYSSIQQSWGYRSQLCTWSTYLFTWVQELRVSMVLGSAKSACLGFLQVKKAISTELLQSRRLEYSVTLPPPPLSPTTLIVSGGDTVVQLS